MYEPVGPNRFRGWNLKTFSAPVFRDGSANVLHRGQKGPNPMSIDEDQRDRKRRQAQLRRERKQTRVEAAAYVPTPQNLSADNQTERHEKATDLMPVPTNERDKPWACCYRLALNLNRQGKTADFERDLEAGLLSELNRPLIGGALALVQGLTAAGVRPPKSWLRPPTEEELSDIPAWVSQCVAAARVEQETSARTGQWQRMLAQASGQQTTNAGAINPVHLQRPKRNLEEMAERLERAMSRPGVRREDLEHRSAHYVKDRDGGISNKQIAFMANLIVERQERRSFDENWKIATDFLAERRAQQAPK